MQFFFCHEISLFRIEKKIQEEIWLILDGHRSRINSIALEYFSQNHINILILPAHTSHVCQPFDVGLASPLKSRIKDFCDKPNRLIFSQIQKAQNQTAKDRILIIAALINAWRQVASPANCSGALFESGICPYNLEK